MPTRKLSLEFEDSGEFIVVQRAVTQTLERHRKDPLWWRIIYWLGFCPARSKAKYKKNVEPPLKEELPDEIKLLYVAVGSIRSGKEPTPERVIALAQKLEDKQKERDTDALMF